MTSTSSTMSLATGLRALTRRAISRAAARSERVVRWRRASSGATSSSSTAAAEEEESESESADDDARRSSVAEGPVAPHVPVLTRQVLEAFRDLEMKTYVDGTMGAGGHACAVIGEHLELVTFVGFDVDPLAHAIAPSRIRAAAAKISEARTRRGARVLELNTVLDNFRAMRFRLDELELNGKVDAILLDLGVSSMHLDSPERGFSFGNDGPLDMRMGPSCAFSAMDVVNEWPEEDIARVIRDYGEEKHWRLIARRICEVRRTSAAVNAALPSSFLSFPFLSFPFLSTLSTFSTADRPSPLLSRDARRRPS
tara:strand:+ start:262 stop:1194 length:933 start_codon:yes stop_codon:yes gene_type:complete